MSVDALFAMSRFGLESERLRLEVASRNIAMANTPLAAGDNTGALQVVTRANGDAASFAAALQSGGLPTLPTLGVADAGHGVRVVHDPVNPLADADGNVRYAEVGLAAEMTTLVSASRGYEANVRALNALRQMLIKALEIGGWPMSVDAIASIAASAAGATAPATAPAAEGTGFADLLSGGVTKLDGDVQQAESLLQNLAAGRDVPVHDLMIAMEQARLDLQFAVEVRNRAVEAYQEFMRMQL